MENAFQKGSETYWSSSRILTITPSEIHLFLAMIWWWVMTWRSILDGRIRSNSSCIKSQLSNIQWWERHRENNVDLTAKIRKKNQACDCGTHLAGACSFCGDICQGCFPRAEYAHFQSSIPAPLKTTHHHRLYLRLSDGKNGTREREEKKYIIIIIIIASSALSKWCAVGLFWLFLSKFLVLNLNCSIWILMWPRNRSIEWRFNDHRSQYSVHWVPMNTSKFSTNRLIAHIQFLPTKRSICRLNHSFSIPIHCW